MINNMDKDKIAFKQGYDGPDINPTAPMITR
jgi:hypothetical protein